MNRHLLAYLDAGAGAAVAAVIASGAVGVRAVLGSTKDKLRRRAGRSEGEATPAASEGSDR